MELFRITKEEFSRTIFAPGFQGRWNRTGEEVIYASWSRSLACLENMVHQNSGQTRRTFRTMVIYVPDQISFKQVNLSDLPNDWNQHSFYKPCQEIGSPWFQKNESLLLRVPSAVIPDEQNFVINTLHPEFFQVKLIDVLPFYFDKRL